MMRHDELAVRSIVSRATTISRGIVVSKLILTLLQPFPGHGTS
jgi:hypothetical protein